MGGKRLSGSVLAGITAWAIAFESQAQPPSEDGQQVLGPYRRPPPTPLAAEPVRYLVPVPPDTSHLHDGFYVRFAGGLGAGFDRIKAPGARLSLPKADGDQGTARGLAVNTELAMGMSIWHALVLGVSCETALMPKPTASAADDAGKYTFEASQLALFGPFADWYVKATSGWHLQASPGVSVVVMGYGVPPVEGPSVQAHTAVGFGFMLGAGHEWWVADQWGLGVLGRFLYSWSGGYDPKGASWDHRFGSISLLMTATYQ